MLHVGSGSTHPIRTNRSHLLYSDAVPPWRTSCADQWHSNLHTRGTEHLRRFQHEVVYSKALFNNITHVVQDHHFPNSLTGSMIRDAFPPSQSISEIRRWCWDVEDAPGPVNSVQRCSSRSSMQNLNFNTPRLHGDHNGAGSSERKWSAAVLQLHSKTLVRTQVCDGQVSTCVCPGHEWRKTHEHQNGLQAERWSFNFKRRWTQGLD